MIKTKRVLLDHKTIKSTYSAVKHYRVLEIHRAGSELWILSMLSAAVAKPSSVAVHELSQNDVYAADNIKYKCVALLNV